MRELMVLIKFQDPKTKSMVGASPDSTVKFPSGSVVYGPEAQAPTRPRKTETVAAYELHKDSPAPTAAEAKKIKASKATTKKASK